MNRAIQKKVVLCILVLFVVFIVVKVTCLPLLRKQSAAAPVPPLPEDVESVLKGYKYSETNGGLQINISGRQIIRRGKKILGLRSNLVKTNFFEEINGTVMGPKGSIIFSASDAEWDADTRHPLMLKKNIAVTINGEAFSRVRTAKIFFNQGRIEVTTTRTKIYNFK
jgi:hypothetical protein